MVESSEHKKLTPDEVRQAMVDIVQITEDFKKNNETIKRLIPILNKGKGIEELNENFVNYGAKLDDTTSKVSEGVDRSYDVLNGCITAVDTLKRDFEIVKTSNAEVKVSNDVVLNEFEKALKESINVQNHFYSALSQAEDNLLKTIGGLTTIIETNNADAKTDIEKHLGDIKERDHAWREYFLGIHSNFKSFVDIATAINKNLTEREQVYIANLIKSANTAEIFRESAESIDKVAKELPSRFDNVVKYIAGVLFDTQRQSLDSLENKFTDISGKASELHFMQRGQHDEFERMMDDYKATISRRKKIGAGVGLTAVVLAAGFFGYQYFENQKTFYSNVNLQDIKCEQPVYIERVKGNTTYCNQDDKNGIVFIDDKDNNGKADYIVVRKNRDGSVVYYGMDFKSIDAENNPNQFVKANNILAEQRENFNNRLKPGESYAVKLKRFVDDKIKVFRK